MEGKYGNSDVSRSCALGLKGTTEDETHLEVTWTGTQEVIGQGGKFPF